MSNKSELPRNECDVAGTLQTYAQKARGAMNTEDLREIIRDLRKEFDLRTVRHTKERR